MELDFPPLPIPLSWILLAVLPVLFYLYAVRPMQVLKKLGVSGPTPLPLIGNLHHTIQAGLYNIEAQAYGMATYGDGMTRFHTIAEVTALMAPSSRSHGDLLALSSRSGQFHVAERAPSKWYGVITHSTHRYVQGTRVARIGSYGGHNSRKGPARRVFGVFFGTIERDLDGDRRASRRLPAYFWPRAEPARDLTAARPNCKSRSAPYHTPHGSRRATDRAADGSLTETGRKIRRTLGVMTPAGVYAEDMPNGRRFKCDLSITL
ncbi:Thromboxane-A synthase [Branchiostoma belcheri]|nr:Thromboxane-A synthase [Branchiostoma belcheri]